MWTMIQDLLPALLIILVLTQYIIPIILGTKTWWLFKPSTIKEELKAEKKAIVDDIASVKAKVEAVKTKVNEVKTEINEVKAKVDETFKSAEDLKNESDNLLK